VIGEKIFKMISLLEKRLLQSSLTEFENTKIEIPIDVKIIEESPIKRGNISYFSTDSILAISELNPDVIIRFGFGILKGELLKIPRFGVWSYHHGDNRNYRGRPACFWEIIQGKPYVGAILQILNEDLDNGTVIDRVQSKTIKNSLWLTMNQLYISSKQMSINQLHYIYRSNKLRIQSQFPILYDSVLYRYPGLKETFKYTIGLIQSKLINQFSRGRKMNWVIYFGIANKGQHPLFIPLYKLKKLKFFIID
jgi:hypothetical protein